MSRAGTTATLLLAGVLTLAACRQFVPLPQNRYLQPRSGPRVSMSTADARQYFDHQRHAKTFAVAEVECIDCHRFDFVIDTSNETVGRTLSTRGLYDGSAACHTCHVDEETRMAAAPDTCLTCHTNIAPLLPDNHQVAWLEVHAADARANPAQCESCHRQSYCVDCHNRRDSIQTIAHERNFLFLHGIEARADPMQCSSCHREDFCINCHLQGGLQP